MNEQEIERLQKRARQLQRIITVISIAVFVLLAASHVWVVYVLQEEVQKPLEFSDLPPLAASVVALPLLLAGGLYALLHVLIVRGAYQRFNLAFKNAYVLPAIRALGGFENLSYTPGKGFPYNEVWDSCVIATGDPKYYKSEDLLTGTYQGMRFSYCDVITQFLKRQGKRSHVETIFYGQIMCFSLPEGAKWSFGHLQVMDKELFNHGKGRTAPHKIQVESESFNRRFQVFAADEHNAFYLLTPQMLDQIVQFADTADGQIALTFVGTSLYVAINNLHSMFEASLKKPFDEQKQDIQAEAELLRRAGELLVLEANHLSHSDSD